MSALTEFDLMVLEFMNDYGVVGQLSKTNVVYNPATSESTSTTVNTDMTMIVPDLTLQGNGYSVKYGTMIQAGDKEVFARPPKKAGASSNPVIDPATDVLLVGGERYKIVTYKESNPTLGDDPILYSFYVRR